MPTALSIFVVLSVLWAVVALVVQVAIARGGGRTDHSRRSGSPARGTAYNFTIAMLPSHKESVRLHPTSFAVGIVMHLGVLLAVGNAVALLVQPTAALGVVWLLTRLFMDLSLACAIFLLVRRFGSPDLRALSAPDDYFAIVAVGVLLAFALCSRLNPLYGRIFLVYAGLFCIYLPLGKLRHAVFFFAARGDLGRRLGYRGVYPPATQRTE